MSSSYAHHRRRPVVRHPYHGEIDYFAVFYPETEDVYLIPIADLEKSEHPHIQEFLELDKVLRV